MSEATLDTEMRMSAPMHVVTTVVEVQGWEIESPDSLFMTDIDFALPGKLIEYSASICHFQENNTLGMITTIGLSSPLPDWMERELFKGLIFVSLQNGFGTFGYDMQQNEAGEVEAYIVHTVQLPLGDDPPSLSQTKRFIENTQKVLDRVIPVLMELLVRKPRVRMSTKGEILEIIPSWNTQELIDKVACSTYARA